MGIRNIWFDGLSFLVAVLMVISMVVSIVQCRRDGDVDCVGTAVAVGVFLFLAILYFWMSMQVGNVQRRRREKKTTGNDRHHNCETDGCQSLGTEEERY